MKLILILAATSVLGFSAQAETRPKPRPFIIEGCMYAKLIDGKPAYWSRLVGCTGRGLQGSTGDRSEDALSRSEGSTGGSWPEGTVTHVDVGEDDGSGNTGDDSGLGDGDDSSGSGDVPAGDDDTEDRRGRRGNPHTEDSRYGNPHGVDGNPETGDPHGPNSIGTPEREDRGRSVGHRQD